MNDEMSNGSGEVTLYPVWKQAVQEFLAEFAPGEIVPHEWLWAHFGLEAAPTPQTPLEEAKRKQIRYMKASHGFRETLLHEHDILLVAKSGAGLQYIHAHEQAEVSEGTVHLELRKSLRKGAARLAHTNLALLNAGQRKGHADALARVAGLRVLVQAEARKLPSS